ncbi:MAG: LysR family transcriptional regulator [Xanthobacteraceae bacterium]|jgi:DNA-binding transcriptional LysR family regulator
MDRVSTMLSFVKVVDTGGFTSAARQLNLATSVVTAHVKALEERLGVRLLNRTTRSLSLTEAGRVYYERCVQILSEMEDADEAAQVLQSKPRGVLRLNTSPGIPQMIAPSIAEYSKLYPEVTIRLTATSRMLDLVEEGYDLAIWYAAVSDPSLIVRRLISYRMAVCASPDYFAKHGRPQHPSDLTKHNCLIFYDATHSKDGKEWVFTGPEGEFPVRMSGNLETNSPIAFRRACIFGQGILIGPTPFLIEDLASGALVSILDEFLPKQFSIDALYPHREHLPAKVRTFIDLLAKNFRQKDFDAGASEPKRANDPLREVVAPGGSRPAAKQRTPG